MLTEALKAVAEFHVAGGAPVRWGPFPDANGEHCTVEELKLRRKLVKEEFNEFKDALDALVEDMETVMAGGEQSDHYGDLIPNLVDALCDMTYVILGTFHSIGVDGSAAFAEVHRSNMTKFPTTLREDGKVLKGPNFEEPNLHGVMGRQLFDALISGQHTSPYLPQAAAEGDNLGVFDSEESRDAFVDNLQEEGASPEDIVALLGELGVEAVVQHHPGCGHDHSGEAASEQPIAFSELDEALRELFAGADEHLAEAHAAESKQSISEYLRDSGFSPEPGIAG